MGIVMWSWFGGPKEPWRKLVDAAAIEVIDEDTGEIHDLPSQQDDPTDIEGLLIRFLYCDTTGHETRRIILCWQCWMDRGVIYVRGFCPMRNALRTFRADRMSELEEVRSKREISDIDGYFRPYAEHRRSGQEISERAPEPIVSVAGRAPTQHEIEFDALWRHRRYRARHECVAGLRILAYIALADDVMSEEERNVEVSFIEARLAMAGFEHDADITESMIDVASALAVPPRSLTIAVNAVAKDQAYFRLVLDCALRLVEVEDGTSDLARTALERLIEAGTTNGWMASAGRA